MKLKSWLDVIVLSFVLIITLPNGPMTSINAFHFLIPSKNSYRIHHSLNFQDRKRASSAFITDSKSKKKDTRRRKNPSAALSLSLSLNPNDLESPEERKQRLEWADQISKSFYMNETGVIIENEDGTSHTNNDNNYNHTVLTNVPLWRVQWTELPGYQNVLYCHVPHYTHMFRKVLYGPKPWYFGHIYLPRGSENLENPDYSLCSKDSRPDVTHIGTLMKVTDYEQLENGELMLIVQALNKFQVTRIHQHLPFAVATVKLVPDQESIHYYYQQVQQQQQQQQISETVAYHAATEAAVLESLYWEPFEYRNLVSSECTQKGGVSLLANYNQTANIEEVTSAKEPQSKNKSWNETLSNCFQTFLENENEEEYLDYTIYDNDVNSLEEVMEAERNVWIQLDYMIQLLILVNPNPSQTVPIPTQILGLIPAYDDDDDDDKWPAGFKLGSIAKQMSSNKNQLVGTLSKSPFVLLSSSSMKYPKLRRAQRLSFAIWSILDTLLAGYDPAAQTRQSVLELESTKERLLAAERGIQVINRALEQVLKK